MLLALAAGAAAGDIPGPVRFWERPPRKEPTTILVWQFDDKAVDDKTLENALLAGLEGDDDDDPLIGRADQISFVLKGDAATAKDGRFGGGVRLRGKGTIRSAPVDLAGLVRNERGFTLEFWVRPEAVGASLPLEIAARGTQPALQLSCAADGQLQLRLGDRQLATHPTRLSAGRWRHLAVIAVRQKGTAVAKLLVDGEPAASPASAGKAIAGFLHNISNTFVLGRRFQGGLDAVRLSRRELPFYALQDQSFTDVAAERPVVEGPPYFSSMAKKTLHCSFDKTLQPAAFAGLQTHGKDVPKAFVPGVRGQALDLSQADALGAAYIGMGVLPPAGTMEFWLRPKNWDNSFVGDYRGTNVKSTILFRMASKNRMQPYMGLKKLRIRQGRSGADSGPDLIPLHPGKWTHVAIVWKAKGRAAVYIDARPQKVYQIGWGGPQHVFDRNDYEAWKTRTGGKQDGTYRLVFSKSPTLIDELRIYPWPMKPQEVRNARQRYFPNAGETMKPLPVIEANFQYYAHDWENVDKLKAAVTCLPVKGIKPDAVDAVLTDTAGKVVGQQQGLKLNQAGTVTAVFRRQLAFGKYSLKVTSTAAGKALTTETMAYERVKPAWYGNQLGKERGVPKPWTPMTVDGSTVSVWGRKVVLSDTGLPKSITTLGKEVLAAPVAFDVSAGGTPLKLAAGTPAFTEKAEDRVAWKSTGKLGSLATEISTWMEYDGLMYFTVTLKPTAGAVKLDHLHVRFPMTEKETSQLIANGAGRNFRASWDVRMLSPEKGSIWNSRTTKPKMQRGLQPGSFLPQIWVGGDAVGLSFSGENDKGWSINPDVAAQEVLREDGNIVFRMNVISLPTTIDKEHSFHFIVLPTPTKPMPAGWRGWNRMKRPTPLAVYDAIDDFCGFPMQSDPKNPQAIKFHVEPHSWESAAIQSAGLRAKFGKENPAFFYMDYSWPRPGEQFKDWNHDLWAGTGRLAWTIPEVEDYMVWIITEYIKRGLIDGIYVDDVSCGRTWSLAGTAYPWDGNKQKRRQGFTAMGFRRFCQRLWKVFRQHGKDPHIMSHMTYCFEIPALSFNMSIVNGEARMIGLHAKHDTMDAWHRNELRIMGNGPKWGFATFWKPTVEINEGIPKAKEVWYYHQVRALHANIMQSDMWYLWHYPSGNVILPSLRAFDMSHPKMRFIPYWENSVTKVTAKPAPAKKGEKKKEKGKSVEGSLEKDIVVGVFVKPGKALLMVSNFARTDVEVTLDLDAAKLCGKPGRTSWRDADLQPLPPKAVAASAADIKKAEKKMLNADPGLGDDDDFDLDDAENLLDGKDPRQVELERLRIQPKANTVKFIIRKRDYRLLEVKRP